MANPAAELRYHIRLFDDTGAEIDINNLTRDEVSEFNAVHSTDDLDYRVSYGPLRNAGISHA